MGSAHKLLLAAAVAVAIAAGARADMTLANLTLSPAADSLITTRGDAPTTVDTTTGNAAPTFVTPTAAPVTEAPVWEAPATTAPPATAPPTYSASASGSGEQQTIGTPETADAPSIRSKATQTATQTAAASASKSTTSTVDTFNDANAGISAGNSSSNRTSTILPAGLGALACVGAIVMAVTYKKKSNTGDDSTRPNSDCEYTGGIDFTPENRTLTTVPEDSPQTADKLAVMGSQSTVGSVDLGASNSSVRSTSPFASSRCNARVSNFYSNSETNMEFQDSCVRHEGGSHVVLTFDENTDSNGAPQVQL
ncbi:unnamed protein product [Phytophthora fragariaefolia]|uniref:Unnamed protein product n=1 Tax=Phytophthora fragariaefolia TaxID=1490495 RepID=A0A9W6Y4Y4_9STRA|nr:unnamed protein product [Phytophthora fragariaefolia]